MNYADCLNRLRYAIEGYKTYLGLPEEWRFHQLMGDVYLQCPDRSLIDLPRAEKCFLTAAKYATSAQAKAMAIDAASVAAYNQGRMEAAEKYAQQACDARRNLPTPISSLPGSGYTSKTTSRLGKLLFRPLP